MPANPVPPRLPALFRMLWQQSYAELLRRIAAAGFDDSPEDKGYLIDLPAAQKLGPQDQWFAVFMLVQNNGSTPQRAADDYVIRDTQGNEFRPITMGPRNVFAYRKGAPVPPDGRLPLPDSPPGQNSIQGSMLLFKIPNTDLENRPLELEISSSSVPNTRATIDLDV